MPIQITEQNIGGFKTIYEDYQVNPAFFEQHERSAEFLNVVKLYSDYLETQQLPKEPITDPIVEPQNIVEPKEAGYSEPMVAGGREGRFNWNEPPKYDENIGGGTIPMYRFETEEGGAWDYRIDKRGQGGRWETTTHAEKEYNEWLKNPDLIDEHWGKGDDINIYLHEAVNQGKSFEEVKQGLKQFNTYRQISGDEPTGIDPIRDMLSPETAELYDKIKKQQADVEGDENIIQRSLGVLKEKFTFTPEQEAKFGELVQGFGIKGKAKELIGLGVSKDFDTAAAFKKELIKELEDKPLASEFITGLFGERTDIGQELTEAVTKKEKFARGAAGLAGVVISFAPISKAIKYVGVGARIAVKHRLIGRLIGSIETFVAHGQIMTTSKDYNERLKLAGQDLATGLVFGLVGGLGKDYLKGITGELASYPAMFGVGFGMSKMGDSSDEDAIINGILLVALHGLFDIGGRKKAKTFLADKLKEQGIDKPESVIEEAFKQAEEFKRTNQKDYEELFGISKPFKPIKPFEPADVEEVSKLRAEQAIKKAEAERKLTVPEPEIVEKERIKTIPPESKITPEKPEIIEKPKEVKIEKPKEEAPRPIIPAIATTENIDEFLGQKLEPGKLGKDDTGYFVQDIKTGKKDRIAPSQAVNYINEMIEKPPIKPKIAEKPKEAPTIPKVDDIATTGKLDSEKVIPEPTVKKPKPEPEPTIKEDKKFFTDIYKDIENQIVTQLKISNIKDIFEADRYLVLNIKSSKNFKVVDKKIKIKSPQGEYEFAVPTTKTELKDLKSSINEAFKQDKGFVRVISGIRKRTPIMESLRVLEDKTAPPERVKTAKALLEIEGIGFKKGVKEAKNKAEHQDHKQNPYTPGTLEWNKWNEAWKNYDSLEQEPTKLYGGLPFHLLIPEKIRLRVRTFFEPFANIPEGPEAQIKRYEMIGKLDKADDFIKKVYKELDTFDGEVKKDMFRYLDGQLSLSDLPVEARPIAKKTQQRLINIGKMLVKRDIISEETFEGLKGKYVPYMYARHIIGDGATTRLSPGGGLDLSYTIARNPDLTVTQKRALGQIEDASVAVPAGMGKALADIAKFDYYTDIAKNSNWTWKPSLIEVDGKRIGIGKLIEDVKTYSKMAKEFPESPEIIERYNNLKEALDKSRVDTKNAPSDFKAMPVSKRFGDLSGAYIRKPIADDIIPLIGTKFGERGDLFGILAKVEQQGVALHKMGKVALNPPTVFRNVVSNFLQNNMRGRALAYIPGDLVKAGKSILSEDKHFKEAKKYGLFRTNWSVTEIRDVINEFAGVDPGKWGSFYKAVSNISKYYGKIDDVAKHTIFVQLRSDGVPVEKAILEAHKWGMDYSLGSRSIKELRRHVMPFTTYQYKIAPLIIESLSKRPWVIGKYLAIPFIMKEAAQQLEDISDDDWKELKAKLPDYVKDNKTYMIIPWKNKEGHWQFVNLEYYFPWGNQLAITKDISKGQWDEAAKNSGIGNPFFDLYNGIRTNKDPFTGKQIINPVDSPAKQWLSATAFLSSRFIGSAFTSYGALGQTIRIGEEDGWGNEIGPGKAIGKWFGWNVITVHPKMTAAMKKKKVRELTSNFLKIKNDSDNSAEYIENSRKRFIIMRREIMTGEPAK